MNKFSRTVIPAIILLSLLLSGCGNQKSILEQELLKAIQRSLSAYDQANFSEFIASVCSKTNQIHDPTQFSIDAKKAHGLRGSPTVHDITSVSQKGNSATANAVVSYLKLGPSADSAAKFTLEKTDHWRLCTYSTP